MLHDYEHNGVAPFNLKKKMTFFLSEKIANLDPQFFWLGGGHPDIKLRISVAEFIKKCENPIFVADIADYDIKDIDNIKKNDWILIILYKMNTKIYIYNNLIP